MNFEMDIQQFIDILPQRIHRRSVAAHLIQHKMPFKTEVALRAWAEHDALHYLSGQSFTVEGEECVKYLEKTFHKGWSALGNQYNSHDEKECECATITKELIDQTAEILYDFYDDYQDKEWY